MTSPADLGWDDVRTFLAVAQIGTLPGAAGALGISAATAGRRVQRLETALGAALFDRLPNRLALTEIGRALADEALTMQQGAAALAQRAGHLSAPAGAPVRVTATGSVSLFLAIHSSALADQLVADDVALSLLTTRTALDVAGGEADIALRMRRLPIDGPLTGRRLGQLAFAVYAARRHLDGTGPAADAWRRIGVVGLPETARAPSQSRWLDLAAAERGATVRLRFSEITLRHQAARAGAGITLLPCFLGDADSALARVLDPPPELLQDVHLMLHDQGHRRRPVRAVAEALVSLFRQQTAALKGIGS